MNITTDIWLRAAAGGVFVVVSSLAIFVLERMNDFGSDLSAITAEMGELENIADLRIASANANVRINAADQQITSLKTQLASMDRRLDQTLESRSAFVQLSSAKTQTAEDGAVDVRLELRDAVQEIDFDPRRDDSHVKIVYDGAYFIIAAPQTMEGEGCTDLWLTVNDLDVANSNIRVCHSEGETSVGVSQGVMCLKRGESVSLRMEGRGIQETMPPDAPLIPSIIFTLFKVGEC
jgi:hypothetical protein